MYVIYLTCYLKVVKKLTSLIAKSTGTKNQTKSNKKLYKWPRAYMLKDAVIL